MTRETITPSHNCQDEDRIQAQSTSPPLSWTDSGEDIGNGFLLMGYKLEKEMIALAKVSNRDIKDMGQKERKQTKNLLQCAKGMYSE